MKPTGLPPQGILCRVPNSVLIQNNLERGREIGGLWLKGTKLQFAKMRKFWRRTAELVTQQVNATDLHIKKWLFWRILFYVHFTTIKNKKNKKINKKR